MKWLGDMVVQRSCDGCMMGVLSRLSITNGLGFVEGKKNERQSNTKEFI